MPNPWLKRWRSFRFPIDDEKRRLLRDRWQSLAPELQTPHQLSGRHLTHCGFTTGASYCSFRCTHCYLPKEANQIPIPSFAQMKEQIDANRRFQGPAPDCKLPVATWPTPTGEAIVKARRSLGGKSAAASAFRSMAALSSVATPIATGARACSSPREQTVSSRSPTDQKTRDPFAEVLEKFGAVSSTTDGDSRSGSLIAYRIAGAFARNPGLAARILCRLGVLAISGAIPLEFLRALACGRAHTINIGTHNFMDAAQVANAPNDPVVRARLDACVFKGAVKNRASGEWEAVPMCAMNQSRWSEVYAERGREVAAISASPGPRD